MPAWLRTLHNPRSNYFNLQKPVKTSGVLIMLWCWGSCTLQKIYWIQKCVWLLPFYSGHQIASEVHPQLLSMVTSGPLGQFQLVFQAEDVAEVLDGALDQVESPIFLVCILSIQLAIYRNLQQAVPWSCLWVVWTWLQCQKSYSKTSIGSCLQMRQIWMASTCDLTAGSSCTNMISAVNLSHWQKSMPSKVSKWCNHQSK